MTRPNLPTLRSIAVDPAVLISLPLDALDALLTECDAEAKIVSVAKKAINDAIAGRYRDVIAAAYAAGDKDFGTVRVTDGEYQIVADTPKKVEWDQAELADIRERIVFSGENPSDFIKVAYSVSETAYNAWPPNIRNTFERARTVKPGAMTIKLQRKEAA